MLPTPDTSHVPYARIYEPAEDSFLLLDTLSSAAETRFLTRRFADSPAPLVAELGPGSGVVIAFLTAHAGAIFGRRVLSAAVDVNAHACAATGTTVAKAVAGDGDGAAAAGLFLGAVRGDLAAPLRRGVVDVLVFNPPYVPTEEVPSLKGEGANEGDDETAGFERDSYLLSLAYAGGRDGMEVTERVVAALPGVLSSRGCAYVLLCAGNRPEEVKARIGHELPGEWRVETVGDSGRTAGWEKLQVIRIWREVEV